MFSKKTEIIVVDSCKKSLEEDLLERKNLAKKELENLLRNNSIGSKTVVGSGWKIHHSTIGEGVSIGHGVKIGNSVILGEVKIGDDCVIQNCLIGNKAVVGSKCTLMDSIVVHTTNVENDTKDGSKIFD